MASKVTFAFILCTLAAICYQGQGQFSVNTSYKSRAAEQSVVSDFGNVLGQSVQTVKDKQNKCSKTQFHLKIVRYFNFGDDTLTCTGSVRTPVCIGYCDNAVSWYLVHPHDNSVKRQGKCCTGSKFGFNNQNVHMSCTGSDSLPGLTFNWSGIGVDTCASQ